MRVAVWLAVMLFAIFAAAAMHAQQAVAPPIIDANGNMARVSSNADQKDPSRTRVAAGGLRVLGPEPGRGQARAIRRIELF
jgi:hypothetical protein